MSINFVSAFGVQAAQPQRDTAKLQSVIQRLLGGEVAVKPDNVADLSIAARLQSASSGLKQASSNLAQASSFTQIAANGITEVKTAVEKLRTLAQQASSPALTADNRAQLDRQFQETAAQIDGIVANTTFNGKKLLDGNLTGDGSLSLRAFLNDTTPEEDSVALAIDNISKQTLIGNQNLNSVDSAKAAFTATGNALKALTGTLANVGSFAQTVDFVAATLDSALFNQQAALTSVGEDFLDITTLLSSSTSKDYIGAALTAQASKLPNSVLKLIG